MTETLRHKLWERHGRTFEVLDDQGQPIPNRFAWKSKIGQLNVDLGDSTFAPYLLSGSTLRHGDCELNFADGWQEIKRLGQFLVTRSRLFIQRETSPGVWADVPHGIPTRNIALDYPREGKCTAYLDFPDIQGYAQGARLQVGVEVGGNERQIYGFRFRSPIAGTFRLEWVLDIPDKASLSWITQATSRTDPTPIRIGGRIGNNIIRWSVAESPYRDATVENDPIGGRIVHVFLGPYTVQSMEWKIIYPDTWGTDIGIAANADDGGETADTTWDESQGSSGEFWFGYYDGRETAGQRWDGITIPKGSTINTTLIDWYCTIVNSTVFKGDWYAWAHDDAPQFDSTNRPSTVTKTTAAIYMNQTSPSAESWANISGLQSIVHEIVNRSGWVSGGAINFFCIPRDADYGDPDDYAFEDYYAAGTNEAELTITYTAPGGEYTQDVSGAMPAPSGVTSGKLLINKNVAGSLPSPSGTALKNIAKKISGDFPQFSGLVSKQINKSMVGDVPAQFGYIAASAALLKLCEGNAPNPTGTISKATHKALFGDLPSGSGSVAKSIFKNLSGSFGAISGVVSKGIAVARFGAMPAPSGEADPALRTHQSAAGDMPAASGFLATVLNPTVTYRKIAGIIGRRFKKLIGG